jgi:subtilisin family serine protease
MKTAIRPSLFALILTLGFIPAVLCADSIKRAPRDEVLFSMKRIVRKNVSEVKPRGFTFMNVERVSKGIYRLKVSGNEIKSSHDSSLPISSLSNPCNKSRAKRLARINPEFLCEANWTLKKSDITPNDTYWSLLKGMHQTNNVDIDAPAAWSLTTGVSSVVVGIIDTGIEYTHPDLAANMWVNPNEIANNGIDDDANGYIDDIHGINAINDSGNPLDDNGHGTHVAGTIGAVGNNSTGVTGVAWTVKMVGLKFLSASGSGSTSNAIKGIDYLTSLKTQKGLNVIASNNSWGGGGFSSSLQSAIVRARDAGILFVAAAGNETQNIDATPSYPAAYNVDNVISVGAVDVDTGGIASFSNFGPTNVHIGAPGTSITSTYTGSNYASLDGTSMAAPHVTGVLALMSAANSTLTYTQYRNALLTGSTIRSSLAGYVAESRMLNAYNSVAAVVGLPPATPTPTPAPTAIPDPTTTLPPSDGGDGGDDDGGDDGDEDGLPTEVTISKLRENRRFTVEVDQASSTYWVEIFFGSRSCGVVETSELEFSGKIPKGLSKKFSSLKISIIDPSDDSVLISERATIKRSGNARAKSHSALCRELERSLE